MHKRNDKRAVQARRERALVRWIENRARGYRGHSFDKGSSRHPIAPRETRCRSEADYVDKQIDILVEKM